MDSTLPSRSWVAASQGLILFALQDGRLRFGELRRAVSGVSERVLILQLRDMETTGLLHREVYHQVAAGVVDVRAGSGRARGY